MTKRKLWTPNYQMKISKPTNHKWSIPGGGGVNDQMQIVNTKWDQTPNENLQTYQLQMIDSWGGGVNYQTQIVNTKPPNENPQTYQLQMIDSGGGGGKLPNANSGHQTTNCNSINHKHYFTCKALKMKSQFTFGSLPLPPGTNHL